jgi:DNA primase
LINRARFGQPTGMAGLISPATLEQIRAASDIVDVIGSVLPLKRAGANFVALCPFHTEKTPSFNINPHRQIFHCFGCHKGGDVFTFLREYENLSFVEAVKRLADRANIPLEFENQPGQQQTRHLKETLLQMHEQIAQRWQNALAGEAAGQIAREYLARRGVSDEAIELFRIGYAPELWDDTVNWAKSKGYELPLVEQAGLILRKEDSDHYYDRFRGRLMFPVCDEQARVIAFSGRVLKGEQEAAKYVNSPETPIFTKGRVFYGLDKSKRAILDAGFAVLCEGQLDLIACYMAGVRNIVAPQGTAFTTDHARILKRYADEAVLCFDSDAAGKNAAVRVLDNLLGAGLAIRVATLPAPHDPDSFIKEQGGAAFHSLLKRAEGFFDFYLNRLCTVHDVSSDKGRTTVVKEMAEAVHKTGSAVMWDTYAQKTAQRLGVSPDAVRAEFKKLERSASRPARAGSATSAEPEVPPPSEREFWLLRFLLIQDDGIDSVAHTLQKEWIEHELVRRIVSCRLSAHAAGSWRGVPALIDELDDTAAASLVSEAVAESAVRVDLSRNLLETIRLLRNQYCDRQLAALKIQLSRPGLAEDDTVQILKKQAELRHLKQQPLALAGLVLPD